VRSAYTSLSVTVAGCRLTAHLLVPGSTFTGMTARGRTEKPPGAWTPEQVVQFMLAAMAAGDFYIICPDNDVTRDIDNRRILWAAEDLIRNRPVPTAPIDGGRYGATPDHIRRHTADR
jgi:hypothetical protein